MPDHADNVPNPHTWQSKRKPGNLRLLLADDVQRWQLLQFAKYVVLESQNTSDDIDTIVDRWIQEHN